jgi:peroxiredoxin
LLPGFLALFPASGASMTRVSLSKSPAQQKVLAFIKAYKLIHDGNSPPKAVIARAVGCSRQNAETLVARLVKRGRLVIDENGGFLTGGRWLSAEEVARLEALGKLAEMLADAAPEG